MVVAYHRPAELGCNQGKKEAVLIYYLEWGMSFNFILRIAYYPFKMFLGTYLASVIGFNKFSFSASIGLNFNRVGISKLFIFRPIPLRIANPLFCDFEFKPDALQLFLFSFFHFVNSIHRVCWSQHVVGVSFQRL